MKRFVRDDHYYAMEIETNRLRLRRLSPRDAASLAAYRSCPSVAQYQSWTAMTVEEAEQFARALPQTPFAAPDEWFQFGIANKETDQLIGDIGVCRKSADTVEIGFTLAPAAQGLGLAAEACRAVIEYAVDAAGVTAVVAVIDSRNRPAISLATRLGMSLIRTEIAEFKGALCFEHHFELSSRD